MMPTEKELENILNDKLPEEYWVFQLGVGYVYHNVPDEIKFSKPYPELGKLFWNKIEANIHSVICEDGKPKSNIEELISGDIRSLAEAIMSIVVATYEVTLAIAIPITALVLKKSIHKFCSKIFEIEPNTKLLSEILECKTLEKEISKPASNAEQ